MAQMTVYQLMTTPYQMPKFSSGFTIAAKTIPDGCSATDCDEAEQLFT